MLTFGLLSGHQAIADPWKWSQAMNVGYFAIVRPIYVTGLYLIIFTFFTGGCTIGKALLSRPVFLILGKLCFITALITPMTIQMVYAIINRGLFISFNRVLELGIGNALATIAIALLIYILFEYPLKRLS